jgi:hypothetical protein
MGCVTSLNLFNQLTIAPVAACSPATAPNDASASQEAVRPSSLPVKLASDVRNWDNVVASPSSFVVVNQSGLSVPAFVIWLYTPDAVRIYEHLSWLAGGDSPTHACNNVCIYACHESGQRLVIKSVPWQDDIEEVVHVNALLSSQQNAIVPARVVYTALQPPDVPTKRDFCRSKRLASEYFTCVIMQYAGETLQKVCNSVRIVPTYNTPSAFSGVSPETRVQLTAFIRDMLLVMKQVSQCCKDLYAVGLCYVDLKKCNVLVDRDQETDSHWRVCLCDYGALAREHHKDSCATYPPPSRPSGQNITATSSVVAYGLGVMLFSVLFAHQEKWLRYKECATRLHSQVHARRLSAYLRSAVAEVQHAEHQYNSKWKKTPHPSGVDSGSLSEFFRRSFAQEHTIESWATALDALNADYIYAVLGKHLEVRETDGSAYFNLQLVRV